MMRFHGMGLGHYYRILYWLLCYRTKYYTIRYHTIGCYNIRAQRDVMRWYAVGSLLSDVTEWTLGCLLPILQKHLFLKSRKTQNIENTENTEHKETHYYRMLQSVSSQFCTSIFFPKAAKHKVALDCRFVKMYWKVPFVWAVSKNAEIKRQEM